MKQKDTNIDRIKKTISVYEGNIIISPGTHNDYISYHESICSNEYNYSTTIKEANMLFDEAVPWEIKKKLLFLLGDFATPECFQI